MSDITSPDFRDGIVACQSAIKSRDERIRALEKLLLKLSELNNPETLSGRHLNDERRAQLAFAMIDNVKALAAEALLAKSEAGKAVDCGS